MHKDGKWAKQIIALQDDEGKWDMGKSVNDKMYFPLSDDWRKKRDTRSGLYGTYRKFNCCNIRDLKYATRNSCIFLLVIVYYM